MQTSLKPCNRCWNTELALSNLWSGEKEGGREEEEGRKEGRLERKGGKRKERMEEERGGRRREGEGRVDGKEEKKGDKEEGVGKSGGEGEIEAEEEEDKSMEKRRRDRVRNPNGDPVLLSSSCSVTMVRLPCLTQVSPMASVTVRAD